MKRNQKSSIQKRVLRVRSKVRGTTERPRLSVYRSNKHIYAQIIDDVRGVTLAAAADNEIKAGKGQKKTDLAGKIGKLLAEKALKAKIKQVRFDRGPYSYHGRLKALADTAREAGLEF